MKLGVAVAAATVAGAGVLFARRWRGRRVTKTTEPTHEVGLCRICHAEVPYSELISPCKCKGTQAYVHADCERMWQIESGCRTCRVCGSPVVISHSLLTTWRGAAKRERLNTVQASSDRFLVCVSTQRITQWMLSSEANALRTGSSVWVYLLRESFGPFCERVSRSVPPEQAAAFFFLFCGLEHNWSHWFVRADNANGVWLSFALCVIWPNLGNLNSSGRPEGIIRLRRYINLFDATAHFTYAHALLATAAHAVSTLPLAEQARVLDGYPRLEQIAQRVREHARALPAPIRSWGRELAGAVAQSAAGAHLRAAAAAAADGFLQFGPGVSERMRVARGLLESVEHVRVVAIIHDLLLHVVSTVFILRGGVRLLREEEDRAGRGEG